VSPLLKVTWRSPVSDLSSSTRQPLSGWAIRRVRAVPVQRTETSPPSTVTVRSRIGAELTALVWLLLGGEGDRETVDVFDAEGFEVVDAEGCVVGVLDAPWSDVVVGVAVLMASGGSALMLALVTSRPARSIANQAVADTPATARSQIAATPTANRSFTRMSTLCHFQGDTTA
jgi:hypothetical protein